MFGYVCNNEVMTLSFYIPYADCIFVDIVATVPTKGTQGHSSPLRGAGGDTSQPTQADAFAFASLQRSWRDVRVSPSGVAQHSRRPHRPLRSRPALRHRISRGLL